MSKGNAPKERAKLLVKALLEYEGIQEDKPIQDLRVTWLKKVDRDLIQKEVDPVLQIKATKHSLFYLIIRDVPDFKPSATTTDHRLKQLIGEVIVDGLDRHLGIFEAEEKDEKRKRENRALGYWRFTLKLWDRNDIDRNLEELDKLWEAKKSLQSVADAATANITKPQPEIVTTQRRENVRLRGFNEIRAVTVWEGREQVLGELEQKLRDGLRVLVLTGQGGIGKSSLASKLMEALGIGLQPPSLGADCVYAGVVYYKVQVGTSFDDGAGQLLRDLGEEQGRDLVKPEEKIDKIITYLAGQKWLLVLDNLEDILHPASHEAAGRAVSAEWGQLLNGLVYKNHQSHVIITSREMPVDLGDLRGKNYSVDTKLVLILPLRGIQQKAAIRVLKDYGMQDSEADLVWIVDRVKGNPFILTLLGSNYATQPGYLRKHPELITDEAAPLLRKQLARLPPEGISLFLRMSALNIPTDISRLTLLRLYQDDKSKFKTSGGRSQIIKPTPAEIAETQEIVNKLVASNLVLWGYDKQKKEKVYDV